MNLIEALKQADGKKVSRKAWSPNRDCWFLECGQLKTTYGNAEPHTCKDNLLADDWYVVEPKSKIEEAIEEAIVEMYGGTPRSSVGKNAFKRVVNIALDEAKGVVIERGLEATAQCIDALKVKE